MNIKGWVRTAAALFMAVSINANGGGLTPPPGVSVPFISPTESYVFWINPLPVVPGSGVLNPDYYPPFKILQDQASIDRTGPWSIGNPQGYDHGYELLGFAEPNFDDGLRSFFYWDCGDACNGGIAQADQVVMPTELWRDSSESCTRNTLGHELMHKIQRAYSVSTAPDNLGKWVTEGHARALQDKIYEEFDTEPDTDCRTKFIDQVNDYLEDELNVSLWNLSYDAALWWAYLMEQYGEVTGEPWYGADFLVTWYDQALLAGENANSFGITNSTIKFYDSSQSITSTFRSFVLANIIKDMRLTNLSAAFLRKYSYVDEQEPGEDRYAEVTFAENLSISNASTEDTASFFADDFAVQNFKINVSACASGRPIRIAFEPSPTDPFFGNPLNQSGAWGVIVGQSSDGSQTLSTQRPAKLYKKLDEQWSVEFFQPFSNPYESVYATTSGIGGPVIGTLRAQCLPVPPNPYAPDLPLVNPLDPVTPGTPFGLTFGEVCAQPSAPLPGLDPDDYTVEVNFEPARVLAATPDDNGHCLLVEIPDDPGQGVFDLTVGLAGEQVTIPAGLVINVPNPNVVIAIDASATMAQPAINPKLTDVQTLVAGFIRQRVDTASGGLPKIGLVDFAGDDLEPNSDARVLAPLLAADEDHIDRLNISLDSLSGSTGGFSAIGDGISAAQALFASSGDSDQSKHVILIVDGPENDGAFWDDIRNDILASGINVHAIALGPLADQPLLYDIARSTGGSYRYVHVDDSGSDHVALAEALSDIALQLTGGLSIDQQRIDLPANALADFTVAVPPNAQSLLLPAVQSARSVPDSRSDFIGTMTLTDPNGQDYVFDLLDTTAALFRINAPRAETLPPGEWKGAISTNDQAEGDLALSAAVILETPIFLASGIARPEADDPVGSGFVIGDPVQLNTTLVDICAREPDCEAGEPGAGTVDVRFGNIRQQTLDLQTPEKGSPDGDGRVVVTPSHSYSAMTFAYDGSPSGAVDDGLSGGVGSYTFQHRIALSYQDFQVSVYRRDGLAVTNTGERTLDSENDGLPDAYEARKYCLNPMLNDADQDLDNDGLNSLREFQLGTDPCNPDTDGGGETDGSEVNGDRQPLLANDDALGGIRYARVAHEVTHDDPQTFSSASITIEYATFPNNSNISLKRGVIGGSTSEVATLLPGTDALYVDTGLNVGTEYCYQLEPSDAAGNQGVPSDWFCAVAMADPAMPWGDVLINNGRPRTDNARLELQTSLYNKSTSTSEMRIFSDARGEPFDSGWIPYAATYSYQHPQVTELTDVVLKAQFRDPQGLVSDTYTDSIELWPPQSLGKLVGRALLETVSPVAGVMLLIDGVSHEPPAYTNTEGQFELCDLPPGDYSLLAVQMGWDNATSESWTVMAGDTTDVGDIELSIILDSLFADGFEGSN